MHLTPSSSYSSETSPLTLQETKRPIPFPSDHGFQKPTSSWLFIQAETRKREFMSWLQVPVTDRTITSSTTTRSGLSRWGMLPGWCDGDHRGALTAAEDSPGTSIHFTITICHGRGGLVMNYTSSFMAAFAEHWLDRCFTSTVHLPKGLVGKSKLLCLESNTRTQAHAVQVGLCMVCNMFIDPWQFNNRSLLQ